MLCVTAALSVAAATYCLYATSMQCCQRDFATIPVCDKKNHFCVRNTKIPCWQCSHSDLVRQLLAATRNDSSTCCMALHTIESPLGACALLRLRCDCRCKKRLSQTCVAEQHPSSGQAPGPSHATVHQCWFHADCCGAQNFRHVICSYSYCVATQKAVANFMKELHLCSALHCVTGIEQRRHSVSPKAALQTKLAAPLCH